MAARFEVQRAFALEDRALFVLAGSMSEGMARVGMTARLSGDEEVFARPIHGVELLEVPETGDSLPCLTFHCRDAERRDAWLEIDWEGRSVELGWQRHSRGTAPGVSAET